MKIYKKVNVSITFVNGEAEKVMEFYKRYKVKHKEIYMKGVKAIEKGEKK